MCEHDFARPDKLYNIVFLAGLQSMSVTLIEIQSFDTFD